MDSISNLVLQAARAAIRADHLQTASLPDVGPRNQPLLPLLVGLLDAAVVTAAAINDNAWDSGRAFNRQLSVKLAKQCRGIAGALESAASTEPSLPAMPAPSTDQGPRQTLMNFRTTPNERQQMQALAVAHGTTVSDLIRRGLQLQGFEPQR